MRQYIGVAVYTLKPGARLFNLAKMISQRL